MSNKDPEAKKDEKSFFGIIIHSFFVIPFLIAVSCVLLFTAVQLLTREQQTVYDLLEDVKTGGTTKRWQAAFELSRILTNPKLIPLEPRFISELINVFKHSREDDHRVQQYLALAMGRTGNSKFLTALAEELQDTKEENLYTFIYALGMLKDNRAAQLLYPYLSHPNARIRSISVASLGNLDDPQAVTQLSKVLNDPEPNVQWGAAISLAKMGDASGIEILSQLLNPHYLVNFPEVDSEERVYLLLSAIEAGSYLNDPNLNEKMESLAQSEKNMKVRSAVSKAFREK